MLVAELTSSSFLELLAAGSAGLLAYVVAVVPFDQLRAWGGRAAALVPDRSR
jgi:hypothetical protein